MGQRMPVLYTKFLTAFRQMSIYVASSPYRSSLGRKKINLSFPKLSGLFRKRKSIGRNLGGMPTAGISIQERRLAYENAGSHAIGGSYASGAGAGIKAKRGINTAALFSGAAGKMRAATLKMEFGPTTAISGLAVVAILMSLLYLMNFNQVATKGYDLRRLEVARQQLLNQYEIKNMKLTETKALSSIISSDRISAMRQPGEVTFVRGNTAIASVP
jgi:hypothetical protein